MRIIIYESSSRGGCFDYAKEIFKTYSSHYKVEECILLLPNHTKNIAGDKVLKILINDSIDLHSSLLKKIYFLWRVFINPFILLFFLVNKKSSLVILNDFEQSSAFLWIPFYKLFLKKHSFAVVLHDPDRDQYPPSKAFSEFSMKCMMGLMDLGIYHEKLPDKKYYKSSKTKYINVPHGIYNLENNNINFKKYIKGLVGEHYTSISILGNIRKEKNYHLAIESLIKFPLLKLIIAGSPSNQDIDLHFYKELAKRLDVEDRIIWIERFLRDDELAALVEVSEIILLNYARTFTSQSGILNVIAPYKKKIIVSKGDSGLHNMVKKFKLGILIEPDNLESLTNGIQDSFITDVTQNWEAYTRSASWKKNIDLILEECKSINITKEDKLIPG